MSRISMPGGDDDWPGLPEKTEPMKLNVGNVTFDVKTMPGLPPESFAIVSESEVAIWQDGTLLYLKRAEYDRRLLEYSQGDQSK